MSQFRRGRRWVAKFQLHGKQVWVPGGPWETKGEARRAEQAYRERLGGVGAETCAGFAARWLREWPREASSTRRLYAQAAELFAAEFGQTPLDEVGRSAARGWALGQPRNVSKIVGTMYEDARDVGLVEANPFSGLRLPSRRAAERIAPPSLAELEALTGACAALGDYGPEFRALVQFAAWTGLRSAEVQALRWPDVEAERVTVRGARKDDGSYGLPKNGRERIVPLLRAARVLGAVPRREGSPFVFHTPRGLPLGKGSLHYHWRAVREASGTSAPRRADGIRPIRFHDLRHFCATRLLEMGATHFDVSVMLGHEDGGALVMSRYGHPSKDAARQRLLTIGSVSGTATGSASGRGVRA